MYIVADSFKVNGNCFGGVSLEVEGAASWCIKNEFIKQILKTNFTNDEVAEILDKLNTRTEGRVKDAVEYLGIMDKKGYFENKTEEDKERY